MAAPFTMAEYIAAAEIVLRYTRPPADRTESRQSTVSLNEVRTALAAARSPLLAWADAPDELPGLTTVLAAAAAGNVNASWAVVLVRWALALIDVQSRRAPRDAAVLSLLARFAAFFSNASALHTLVHVRAELGRDGPPLLASAEELEQALRLADGDTALELVTYVARLPRTYATRLRDGRTLDFEHSLARALTRNWPEREAAFRYVSAQRPGAPFEIMHDGLDVRLPRNRYTLAAEALEALLVELVLVPAFVATVISTRLDVTGSAALLAAIELRAAAGAPLTVDDADATHGIDADEEDARVLAGDSVRVILEAARADEARAFFPAANVQAARALALASGDVRVLALLHAAGAPRTGAAVLVARAPEANALAALALLEDVHADGEAALRAAVRRPSVRLAEELLLRYNAYANARDDEALLAAVRTRAPAAMFYVLATAGANVRARDFAALREAALQADSNATLVTLLTLLTPVALLVLTRRDPELVIGLLARVPDVRTRSSLFAAIEQVARERGAEIELVNSQGERVSEAQRERALELARDALRQSIAQPRV